MSGDVTKIARLPELCHMAELSEEEAAAYDSRVRNDGALRARVAYIHRRSTRRSMSTLPSCLTRRRCASGRSRPASGVGGVYTGLTGFRLEYRSVGSYHWRHSRLCMLIHAPQGRGEASYGSAGLFLFVCVWIGLLLV